MTDKEYREQKKRVLNYVDKWFKPMGMGWFDIEFLWSRDVDINMPSAIAYAESMWQYRRASINFNLSIIKNISDERLENAIIHEFVHVLINPLYQENEKMSLQNEYATETIARALQWVRLAGKKDK